MMTPFLTKEDLLGRVLHRDAMMLVIDKPAGIAVHKGPGDGIHLEALFPALAYGLPRNPALAHRLDRETSGCLVLGRHRKALAQLGRLFKQGRIAKRYWAVVVGVPPQDAGDIDLPLARRSHDKRSWWMKTAEPADPAAEAARTRYRVMGRGDGVAWLELEPLTGRTHQLRVHCAALGMAIAGDGVYGGDRARAGAGRIQLHARSIAVPLYPKRPPVAVTAPVPADMLDLLSACGFEGEPAPPGETSPREISAGAADE